MLGNCKKYSTSKRAKFAGQNDAREKMKQKKMFRTLIAAPRRRPLRGPKDGGIALFS